MTRRFIWLKTRDRHSPRYFTSRVKEFKGSRPGSPEHFALQLCLVADFHDGLLTEEEYRCPS